LPSPAGFLTDRSLFVPAGFDLEAVLGFAVPRAGLLLAGVLLVGLRLAGVLLAGVLLAEVLLAAVLSTEVFLVPVAFSTAIVLFT